MSTMARPRWTARLVGLVLAPATWLERSRGRKRLGLLLLYALAAAFVGFWIWWATSLWRLPDLGDPFDVAAYEAERVPEDEDACALYRPAVARMSREGMAQDFGVMWGVLRGGWEKASPKIRRWVEANREALALWRRGTERPKAGPEEGVARLGFRTGVRDNLTFFGWMAQLEGSRLEEEGDMAGAWGWYNAALRCSRHAEMRGGFRGLSVGYGMLMNLDDRVVAWARDPRVDAATLRRALADVRAVAAMTPSASDQFKADYAGMMWALDHTDRWVDQLEGSSWLFNLPPWAIRTAVFAKREPERSRRLYRIVYAHWLSQCERPRADRPPMTTDILRTEWGTPFRHPDFPYAVPPGGPDAAHPLTAERLELWWSSSIHASRLMPLLPLELDTIDQERTTWGVMTVTLAEQLYAREHGGPPPSPEALVGPYLDRLPERYVDTAPAESTQGGSATP